MKFEQKLLETLHEPWRFYYIEYGHLKHLLKEAKDGIFDEQMEALFIEELEKELEKVESFYQIKYGELKRHTDHLSITINKQSSKENDNRIEQIRNDLNKVIEDVGVLSKFTSLNYAGFLKIVKKHDRYTKYNIKPTFNKRLNKATFYNSNYDALLFKLSTLYNMTKTTSKTDGKGIKKDGAQDFVRKTTKYWVHKDNVMELKLFVLKHLPVLVFNPKDEFDTADSAITSIYFDNDDFFLYKGRLEKTEGAQAVRLRWYGSPINNEIFVERKTHKEDWTGEKSIKERFILKEKRINKYLSGVYSPKEIVDKEKKKKIGKSEKELNKLFSLSSEIQQFVKDNNLKPKIRSFYNRTAFQLPDDAKVRISLDTELTLIREDINNNANWRREDVGIDWPFSYLNKEEICRFPYAILEVKLQTQHGTQPPLWTEQLVRSHLVEPVPKFSKFIHGVATLFEKEVQLFPFWLPQMDVDIRKEASKDWKLIANNNNSDQEITINETDETNETHTKRLTNLIGRLHQQRERELDDFVYEENLDGSHPNTTKKIKLPTRIEPKVFFANERTFLSWLHFSIVMASLSVGLLNFGDRQAQISAVLFTIISIIIMLYSLILFVWRAQQIRKDRNSTNFDDKIGPLILVFALIVAIAINMVLKIKSWKNGN